MTKETSASETLEATIANASPSTTVFSDGSTFDYENGYQSNGAPAATRDRMENPKIVKSHAILTVGRVLGTLMSAVVMAALAAVALLSVTNFQAGVNWNTLKTNINDSGQVEVVEGVSGKGIIVKVSNGAMLKCDVSFVSNDANPVGLVFCESGQPATFTTPVPHDPHNIFYVAPIEDTKE